MSADLPIRDIHLPESASWWPVAPGWWLLLLVSLFTGILIYQKRKKKGLQGKFRREQQLIANALQLLHKIRLLNDDKQVIKEISVLLRRTAISLFEKVDDNVAGLTGENWLTFLDKKLGNTQSVDVNFSQGIGRVLIDQPYQKQAHYDKDKLIKLAEKWLVAQRSQQHLQRESPTIPSHHPSEEKTSEARNV